MENINYTSFDTIKRMPLTKGIFFCVVFLYGIELDAQTDFIEDLGASLEKQPVLDVRLDSRNSFVSARFARIMGVKLGADFDNKVKVGLGFNLLRNEVTEMRMIQNSQNENEEVNARFRLFYFSPYLEYSFYNQDRWEISILTHLGVGASNFEYTDKYGKTNQTDSEALAMWEPYMTAEYRLWKYIGLGAGVGYRLVYAPSAFSRRRLNSPIYVFKLKFYFKPLFEYFKERS